MKKNNSLMYGNGENDFQYDPEAEDNSKKYRLPFALCKANGIEVEDWWTPKDAWEALKNGGYVDDVSDEYKEYYRQLKKESSKKSNARTKLKNNQLKDPEHNPENIENHVQGTIAGVKCGEPMSFEQADGGRVNPFFEQGCKGQLIGYRHNCQTCVAVYFARRKGYDVRALPNLNNKNIYSLSVNTTLAFVNQKGEHPIEKPKAHYQKTLDFLNSEVSDNRVYSLCFSWKGRRDGHIVVAERMGGKVVVYDPQTNKQYKDNEITQLLSRTNNLRLTDLTDYNLDEKFCDSIMKGA